jgi:DNA-binding response OmpR family regulator
MEWHRLLCQAFAEMLKQCEGFEELAQVGSIDLAVINPSLLDGDGTDLVRELRGDKHDVPVLVLTDIEE